MADGIQVEIQSANFSKSLDNLPASVRTRLIIAITALVTEMAGRIIARAPDKTGKLRGTIQPRVFTDNPNRVAGYVTSRGDKPKVAALDRGVSKTVSVRAHEAKLDHAWKTKLNSPLTVMVEAHDRRLQLAPTQFFTGPAAGMQADIEAAVETAINQGTQDAQS